MADGNSGSVGCVLVVCRMKGAESAKGGYDQPFVQEMPSIERCP